MHYIVCLIRILTAIENTVPTHLNTNVISETENNIIETLNGSSKLLELIKFTLESLKTTFNTITQFLNQPNMIYEAVTSWFFTVYCRLFNRPITLETSEHEKQTTFEDEKRMKIDLENEWNEVLEKYIFNKKTWEYMKTKCKIIAVNYAKKEDLWDKMDLKWNERVNYCMIGREKIEEMLMEGSNTSLEYITQATIRLFRSTIRFRIGLWVDINIKKTGLEILWMNKFNILNVMQKAFKNMQILLMELLQNQEKLAIMSEEINVIRKNQSKLFDDAINNIENVGDFSLEEKINIKMKEQYAKNDQKIDQRFDHLHKMIKDLQIMKKITGKFVVTKKEAKNNIKRKMGFMKNRYILIYTEAKTMSSIYKDLKIKTNAIKEKRSAIQNHKITVPDYNSTNDSFDKQSLSNIHNKEVQNISNPQK